MIVQHEGLKHEVLVHAPSRLASSGPPPIVLLLHGSDSSGSAQMAYSDIGPVADALGFVVVAPDGSAPGPNGSSWAADGNNASTRDEVAFLDNVRQTATATYHADPERVYLLGYSGGARMASRYALNRSSSVAGLCAIAGLRAGISAGIRSPTQFRPLVSHFVPVLAFHGEQDPINPYHGGGPDYWGYSVPDAARAWAELGGCSDPVETVLSDRVRRTTYFRYDKAGVVLYTVVDGGHSWPGTPYDNGHGPASTDISANALFAKFFSLGGSADPRHQTAGKGTSQTGRDSRPGSC